MWDDGKKVCIGMAFSVTFCVLYFFVFLLTPTGHTRRLITTVYGSQRMFLHNVGPFGIRQRIRGFDDNALYKFTFDILGVLMIKK